MSCSSCMQTNPCSYKKKKQLRETSVIDGGLAADCFVGVYQQWLG